MVADSKRFVEPDNRSIIVLGLAVLGVIIGSLGPWATVWIITVNGTAGDGQITLVLGIAAGAILAMQYFRPLESRKRDWGLAVCFVLAALVGAYDWMNLSRIASQTDFAASVAWALPLMTIAAVAGTIAAGIRIRSHGSTSQVAAVDTADESQA